MTTDAGRIASTVRPTAADPAWRLTPVAGRWLDVSCPSERLCVAGGASGRLAFSTDPGGGAPTWATSVGGGGHVTSLSCPIASFCMAVTGLGNSLSSTAPTSPGSWSEPTAIAPGAVPVAVSCPSVGLCAVADQNGTVLTTTNPTTSAPRWTATAISPAGALDVVCPTTGLCVATDALGNVHLSANPTAAAPTWTQAGRAFGRLSCPSTAFCAAAALDGVFTTTDPATPSPWATPHPLRGLGTTEIDCASASLCVVGDDSGRAVMGVAAPENVAPPGVTGNATIGSTVSAAPGAWTAAPSTSHRWLRCDAVGGGCTAVADGPSHAVTAADAGSTLRVEESGVNAAGSATARSAPTAVVPAPPADQPGPPAPDPPRRPSDAAIKTQLLRALAVGGRYGKLGALRRRGRFDTTFRALTAGRLVVTWHSVPNGRKAKPRLLARARVTIRRAGSVKVRLALTRELRRLARSAKRLRVRVKATFAPTGRKAVTASRLVTLRR